jgi:hypothetical protein
VSCSLLQQGLEVVFSVDPEWNARQSANKKIIVRFVDNESRCRYKFSEEALSLPGWLGVGVRNA